MLGLDRPTILCQIGARHTARHGRCASSVFEHLRERDYEVMASARSSIGRNHLFVPAERTFSAPGSL